MMESIAPGDTIRPGSTAGEPGSRRAPCLVVALDGNRPLEPPGRYPLDDVDEVWVRRSPDGAGRLAERTMRQGKRVLALALPDAMVSARHAELHRDGGAWFVVDRGSTNGTVVNGRRISLHRLADGDVLMISRVALVFRDPELDDAAASEALDDDAAALALPAGLRTMSPSLGRAFADARTMVRSRTPVVILGATGTGKELAARAIHELSGRTGAFVAVNCAEIPAELIGSELFGHRRGAFSGAVANKEGLAAAADGGTLFLDEVAELPLSLQAALLRTLQEGEVRPVGATRPQRIDLRVLSATHVDVPARIEAGRFREDLWSRLVGYTLRLPPLRERPEDLGLLIGGMLARRLAGGAPPTLAADAMAAIVAYPWPRNIRQLEQAVEQAVLRSGGGEIALRHLPPELRLREPAASPTDATADHGDDAGEGDDPRDALIELLRRHRGRTTAAAAELGISRQAIEKRCKKAGIDYRLFREPPSIPGER